MNHSYNLSIMKRTYKYSFDTMYFGNRWSDPVYHRNSDWTIIGISTRWFSHYEFSYDLCFLGFECHIWIKRKTK